MISNELIKKLLHRGGRVIYHHPQKTVRNYCPSNFCNNTALPKFREGLCINCNIAGRQ